MDSSSTESIAGTIRRRVARARQGTFFRRRDFEGTNSAVETALSRMVSDGELIRVRRGLYWRGNATRFGMTSPTVLQVALAVAGTGAGPSGVSAAQFLGLTTQVPSTVEVAVPGKVPDPIKGVRFRSRPYSRREERLTPLEVAVLELLRDPSAAEAAWPQIESRIRQLVSDGTLRRPALDAVASTEPVVAARSRWAVVAA